MKHVQWVEPPPPLTANHHLLQKEEKDPVDQVFCFSYFFNFYRPVLCHLFLETMVWLGSRKIHDLCLYHMPRIGHQDIYRTTKIMSGSVGKSMRQKKTSTISSRLVLVGMGSVLIL